MRYSLTTTPLFRELSKYLPIIILLYFYLFQPPIINKNIYLGLEVFILLGFSFYKRVFVKSFVTLFKNELFLLSLIVIYCIVRDIVQGEEVYSFRFIAWAIQGFFFSFLIIYFFENKAIEETNLLSLLYWVCFLAAFLTLILITNEPIDLFYKSIVKDGAYDLYENMAIRYRAYGVAENLTFTYSYVLGFFAGYTLLLVKKNFFLLIPFFLFLIGVFFNARIGFMPIILFAVIAFISGRWIGILYVIMASVALGTTLLFIFQDVADALVTNKEWVFEFFFDLSDSLIGTNYSARDVSTIDILTGDFIVFPNSFFDWIVGSGVSLFGRSDIQSSDIGYILQLNYGGIILLLLLFILHVYLTLRLNKVIGFSHWFFPVFVLSILLLNFKGFLFAATPGGRFLYFLYIYFVYRSVKQKNRIF